MTATDEAELMRQMERAQQENAEVDGDDDSDEMEGMGKCSSGDERPHNKANQSTDESDNE